MSPCLKEGSALAHLSCVRIPVWVKTNIQSWLLPQAVKTFQSNMGLSFATRPAALVTSKLLMKAVLSTAPAQPLLCGSCYGAAAKEEGGRLCAVVCRTMGAAEATAAAAKIPGKPPVTRTPLCAPCAEERCVGEHGRSCMQVRGGGTAAMVFMEAALCGFLGEGE